MTGSNWTGAVHDWKSALRAVYGAIHFHDDDQGALGWQETFSLTVPADWPSGFYAAHISATMPARIFLPFYVLAGKAVRPILVFLVPTYTYQVYSSYVRPGRGAELADRAKAWGALLETPDANPEFGLSNYNYHADGSGVAHCQPVSRPMLDTRPKQIALNGSRARGLRLQPYQRRQLHRALADQAGLSARHGHRP